MTLLTELGIWPQLYSQWTKQLNTETEWKRPFSSLCIWTPMFTKWLENEVQNTFKNRTRLVCPSLHEPALPKRGRLLPPGGAGRGGGHGRFPHPQSPPVTAAPCEGSCSESPPVQRKNQWENNIRFFVVIMAADSSLCSFPVYLCDRLRFPSVV